MSNGPIEPSAEMRVMAKTLRGLRAARGGHRMIDESCATPSPHECNPYGQTRDLLPRLLSGTRWFCDGCGTVFVLTKYRPDSRPHWDIETKQERRERLGLKWWQRCPR